MGMDPKIIEAIEACRPNSDDMNSPHMESLAQALHEDAEVRQLAADMKRLDSTIASLMPDVQVPEGLQERLLARLALPIDSDSETHIVPAVDQRLPGTRFHGQLTRGRILGLTAGLATMAACLLVAFVLAWPKSPGNMSKHDLKQWTRESVATVQESEGWIPNDSQVSDKLRFTPTRQLATRHGVAYSNHGGSVFLFTAAGNHQQSRLPKAPPSVPISSDDGYWQYARWTDGRTLFVIAVRGTKSDYQRFVRHTAISVAAVTVKVSNTDPHDC